LDGERLGLRLDPPKLDEHGTELLLSLGYSDDEVAALRRDGVLLTQPTPEEKVKSALLDGHPSSGNSSAGLA
jgi:hypothetical protein